MKLGNTPRIEAWSPPLASFSPSALIHATSSSNSLPHLAAAGFWWMASVEWFVRWVTILGRLGGCIYVLGVPLGVLHLALHEILLGREANLVSIKSARFSWFAVLPCQRHISHVRTPNNANSVPGCVPQNYLQLWYWFLSLKIVMQVGRQWVNRCLTQMTH
jgi:hypothetical protein